MADACFPVVLLDTCHVRLELCYTYLENKALNLSSLLVL